MRVGEGITTEETRFVAGDVMVDGVRAWALLGTGPHCATWLGWSERLWLPVALKLPLAALPEPERARAALGREVRRLAQVDHPMFQRMLASDLDAPVPYLVTEYIEGLSLGAILDDEGPFDPDDVVRIGIQVATCLGYLHAHGLAHLDLKPANLMLRDGRVIIIDLGYALPLGEDPPPGGPRGTDGYMPPEQVSCQQVTGASDVFSLGVMLDVLLTGELPCADEAAAGHVHARRATSAAEIDVVLAALTQPDLSRRVASAPRALELLSALVDPADRPWPAFAFRNDQDLSGHPGMLRDPVSALPVPWAAIWSGESATSPEPFARPRELLVAGAGLTTLDMDAIADQVAEHWSDAPQNVLTVECRPGAGTPRFTELHPERQRTAILEGRCSVCGETQPGPFWFLGAVSDENLTPAFREPPLCVGCAHVALARCPGLAGEVRREALVAFRVTAYVPIPDAETVDERTDAMRYLLARPIDGCWTIHQLSELRGSTVRPS